LQLGVKLLAHSRLILPRWQHALNGNAPATASPCHDIQPALTARLSAKAGNVGGELGGIDGSCRLRVHAAWLAAEQCSKRHSRPYCGLLPDAYPATDNLT